MTRIIAITGGSGAGKTTLAQALARRLSAPVIAEDDYYLCASSIAAFDPDRHNFDAPAAKEHALLRAHLEAARRGEAFDKPAYDLVTHMRTGQSERIEPGPALIVEGLHLLCAPDLRALYDVSVYVEADEALRLGRRMIRDVETRGRAPRSVLQQFFVNVRPMHALHIEPQRAFADIVFASPFDCDQAQIDAGVEAIAAALARLQR